MQAVPRAKIDVRLKLDGTLGNIAQAQMFGDCAQMNLHLHHSKEPPDAPSLTHGKGKISKLMALTDRMRLKALRSECLWILQN